MPYKAHTSHGAHCACSARGQHSCTGHVLAAPMLDLVLQLAQGTDLGHGPHAAHALDPLVTCSTTNMLQAAHTTCQLHVLYTQ